MLPNIVNALRAKATIPCNLPDIESAYPLVEKPAKKIQTELKDIKKGSVDYLIESFKLKRETADRFFDGIIDGATTALPLRLKLIALGLETQKNSPTQFFCFSILYSVGNFVTQSILERECLKAFDNSAFPVKVQSHTGMLVSSLITALLAQILENKMSGKTMIQSIKYLANVNATVFSLTRDTVWLMINIISKQESSSLKDVLIFTIYQTLLSYPADVMRSLAITFPNDKTVDLAKKMVIRHTSMKTIDVCRQAVQYRFLILFIGNASIFGLEMNEKVDPDKLK